MQQLQSHPQRNSNLRELPIAPSNNSPVRPPQPRPMIKVTQNARPGQGVGGGAIGRGRGSAKTSPPPGNSEMKNEMPATQTSTPVQKTPNTPVQVNTAEHACAGKHSQTRLRRYMVPNEPR